MPAIHASWTGSACSLRIRPTVKATTPIVEFDGEVDVLGHDDQGLADGRDGDDRRERGDRSEIVGRQEVRGEDGDDCRQNDDHAGERQFAGSREPADQDADAVVLAARYRDATRHST